MTSVQQIPSSPLPPDNSPRPSSRLRRWILIAESVAILALLVLLLTPRTVQHICTFTSKAKFDIWAIHNALEDYALAHGGRYPESLEVLVIPDEHGKRFLQRRSPPIDPWGRAYLYDPPTTARTIPRVYTLGGDGEPGGEDQDADVDNLELPGH